MSMNLVETKTLSSSQASIEFTSIPQDATDLYVLFSGRGAAGGSFDGLTIRFNGSSTGYTARRLFVFNGTITGDTNIAQFIVNSSGSTANTFSTVAFHIPNYAGNANKSFTIEGVTETNTSDRALGFGGVRWSNTNAITSLTMLAESTSNLLAGTTASLYKITKGSSGGVVVS